jgi:hypothetical protein
VVEVAFALNVGDGRWLEERELADLGPLREQLAARDELSGAIVIDTPGEAQARIEDALAPLALWLCADAVMELLDGKPATVEYYEYHGSVRLEPEDSRIRISGDFVPSLAANRVTLLQGLVACGERIAEFLRRVGEPHVRNVELIAPRIEQARAALATAGLE